MSERKSRAEVAAQMIREGKVDWAPAQMAAKLAVEKANEAKAQVVRRDLAIERDGEDAVKKREAARKAARTAKREAARVTEAAREATKEAARVTEAAREDKSPLSVPLKKGVQFSVFNYENDIATIFNTPDLIHYYQGEATIRKYDEDSDQKYIVKYPILSVGIQVTSPGMDQGELSEFEITNINNIG